MPFKTYLKRHEMILIDANMLTPTLTKATTGCGVEARQNNPIKVYSQAQYQEVKVDVWVGDIVHLPITLQQ